MARKKAETPKVDDRGQPLPEPIIPTKPSPKVHPVLRHTGEAFEFVRMTDELCPECNPASAGAKLGVLFETDTAVKVQCPHCDYSSERRR